MLNHVLDAAIARHYARDTATRPPPPPDPDGAVLRATWVATRHWLTAMRERYPHGAPPVVLSAPPPAP
jgi:hypothetical protein